MFTGLISELGEITTVTTSNSSAVFTVSAPTTVKSLAIGDSVAVNGVCLTVIAKTNESFSADVMIQTLSLTSFSQVKIGTKVNLELAATLEMRMGGHIVQGHVDGVGTISRLIAGEKWMQCDVSIPPGLTRFIVNQGSITLDGVSLTVGSINDSTNEVTVWLIPETLAKTNFSSKKSGDLVNIEVDILAKYVERLLKKGAANGG